MNLFLICCTFLVSHLFVFYLESWLDTFLNELSRKMNLVKIFLVHLAALSCNIEEMRDTNKNKLVPNVAQERRQIMKFNLPILGSSPAGNSIQTETHKFSQTNSQPRPPNIYPTLRIFTLNLAFSDQWENIITSSTSNEFLLFQFFLPISNSVIEGDSNIDTDILVLS